MATKRKLADNPNAELVDFLQGISVVLFAGYPSRTLEFTSLVRIGRL